MFFLFLSSHSSLISNHQSSIINHQSSTINHQSSIIRNERKRKGSLIVSCGLAELFYKLEAKRNQIKDGSRTVGGWSHAQMIRSLFVVC